MFGHLCKCISISFLLLNWLESVNSHVPGQSHHHHHHHHAFMGPHQGHHHRITLPVPVQSASMSHMGLADGNHSTTVYNNNQYNSHAHKHDAGFLRVNQHHAVHHVSHALPGQSSVAIQRYYVAPPLSPGVVYTSHPSLSRSPAPASHQKESSIVRVISSSHSGRQSYPSDRYQRPYHTAPSVSYAPTFRPSPALPQQDPVPDLKADTPPSHSHLRHMEELVENPRSRVPPKAGEPHHPSHAHNSPFHPQHDKAHSPFEPRFEVAREEVSDAEWAEEIRASFAESGLLPGLLRVPPSAGLVNINFGTHNCVHMGTDIEPEVSAYEPSAVSYPAEYHRNYTLLMVDADNSNHIHWLLINIPGTNVAVAETIIEYNSPVPAKGSGLHRYVMMAMPQERGYIEAQTLSPMLSRSCESHGRANLNIDAFRRHFRLGEPIAANYFTVKYDEFVDSIVDYCRDKERRS